MFPQDRDIEKNHIRFRNSEAPYGVGKVLNQYSTRVLSAAVRDYKMRKRGSGELESTLHVAAATFELQIC